MKFVVLFLSFLINIPILKAYDQWNHVLFYNLPVGVTYAISSGSGFYVNNNYIITNAHVVQNCRNIAVRGSVEPQLVSLIAKDEEKDLAILYSRSTPRRIPYFRANYNQINYNDKLFIAGYPNEASKTGKFVIKDALVKNIINDANFTIIEFTDIVEHGNSGGPIIDKNSNIVGIVTSEVTYQVTNIYEVKTKKLGRGVGLDGIIEFLSQNKIPYFLKYTYDMFTTYRVDKEIEDYLVNVYCVH